MKMPKHLFVRWEMGNQKGDECLLAFEDADQVVEDDGPSTVGVYELKEIQTLSKRVYQSKASREAK